MGKFYFLALIFCLAIFVPPNVHAWEMCETSVETLDVAGEVTFTSSFCNCMDGDMITILFDPANHEVVIDSVVFAKATPHPSTNESWAQQLGQTFYSVDVVLRKETEKTKTIHLWVYLSTDEHVGVNAHF